jgi:hypothetical protein
MYIASDKVKIYRAYAYKSPDIASSSGCIDFTTGDFLSPRPYLHFVTTGDLGWVEFSEDEWRTVSYDNVSKEYDLIHPNTLSLMPMTFDQLPQDRDENNHLLYFGKAFDKNSGDIVTYYKCLVACTKQDLDASCEELDHIYLYGIFDGAVDFNNSSGIIFPVKDHFKSIMSDVKFSDRYISVTDIPNEFSERAYYSLYTPVVLLTDGANFVYIESGEIIERPLSYLGYTTTPSVKLPAYIDMRNDDQHTLVEYDLRYNSLPEYGYWSLNTRQWSIDPDHYVYIMSKNSVTLYSGEIYLGEFSSFTHKPYDNYIYIYNDGSLEFVMPDGLDLGFISIGSYNNYSENSLYSKAGITDHLCSFILKDDNGDYLTSDDTSSGVPLVWYDQESRMYWNGYSNQWQLEKPIRSNAIIYDAVLNKEIPVYDAQNKVIMPDRSVIEYSDLYAAPYNLGVVRDVLNAIDGLSDQVIFECYYDGMYIGGGRYCIPNRTSSWLTLDELHDSGYRIVDGITVLYNGDSIEDLVYDDNHLD